MPRKCYLCDIWEHKVPKDRNITFHKVPKDESLKQQWLESINKDMADQKNVNICSLHFNEDDFRIQPGGRRVLKKGAIPTQLREHSPVCFESAIGTEKESSDVSPAIKVKPLQDIKPTTTIYLLCSEPIPEPSSDQRLKPLQNISPIIDDHLLCSESIPEPSSDQSDHNYSAARETSGRAKLHEERGDGASDEDVVAAPALSDVSADTSSTWTASEDEMGPTHNVTQKRKAYVGDITNDDFSSPKKAEKAFQMAKNKIVVQTKKIKSLQGNVRVLRKRITNREALFSQLKAFKTYITEKSEPSIKAPLLDPSTRTPFPKNGNMADKQHAATRSSNKVELKRKICNKKVVNGVFCVACDIFVHNSCAVASETSPEARKCKTCVDNEEHYNEISLDKPGNSTETVDKNSSQIIHDLRQENERLIRENKLLNILVKETQDKNELLLFKIGVLQKKALEKPSSQHHRNNTHAGHGSDAV